MIYFPFIPEEYFSWIWNLGGDSSFLSELEKCFATSSGTHGLREKSAFIWTGVPLNVICLFSLVALRDFSLCLVFRSLITISVDVLGLFCLGFTQPLECIGLCFLPN